MTKRNKYFIALIFLFFAGAVALPFVSQDQAAAVMGNATTWILIMMGFFIILATAAIINALDAIKYYVLRKEGRLPEEAEEEVELAIAKEKREGFFARIWKKMQDAKPIEKESEIEMDHNYDGIRELDNNLPPWWLWGFYLSIAFAIIYLVRFHVLKSAPLSAQEYEQQMKEAAIQKAEYLKNAAAMVDENTVTQLTDEPALDEGAQIFSANCAVCHGPDGGGAVGPNLTDKYWLHGGDIKDVFSTIKYGVPSKGMLTWKDQLNPSQIQKVASYVLSLQGTTPANPKDPQGELYEPKAKDSAPEAGSPADSNAQKQDTKLSSL